MTSGDVVFNEKEFNTVESGYQAHALIGIIVKMYALDSEVR